MPSLGDFIRINTGRGFVDVWDQWLQERMPVAQDALADRWEARYMSAPIWRFTLAAGLAGETGAMGVMMPSVDRVGRKFPLTLVALLKTGASAIAGHFMADAAFQNLENIAIDALEDDMTREELTDRLAEVCAPERGPVPVKVAAASRTMVAHAPPGAGLTQGIAAASVERGFTAPSVWSTHIDDDAWLMICEGLPNTPQVVGLFDIEAEIWRGLNG